MLSLSPAVRIHLAVDPTDMRKGFDGLLGLVMSGGRADPLLGSRRFRPVLQAAGARSVPVARAPGGRQERRHGRTSARDAPRRHRPEGGEATAALAACRRRAVCFVGSYDLGVLLIDNRSLP